MPSVHISEVDKVVQPAKVQPTNGDAVRRVTGSADLPLSPEGRTQVKEMAERYTEKFDHVFCGPEQRDIETATEFGKPIILKGLDAWARGAYEGQPAKLVQGAMRNLILHPDSKPPGKSPISGMPGETYNQFLKPLMHVMRTLKEHIKPKERLLVVTSGGNLQAVDQMASAKFPQKIDNQHYAEIARKPYWSATGQLFKLTDSGLEKVSNNKEPACYLCEHSGTSFNPVGSEDKASAPASPRGEVVHTQSSKTSDKAGATEPHEYSSTQVNLPSEIAAHVVKAGGSVKDEDLAEDGRESEPHITLKYGLHGDDAEEIKKVLDGEGPIKATFGPMSLFPAKEASAQRGGANYDVVKVNVMSPDLHRLNRKVSKALAHTDTHPNYQPHVTIAYVKPGIGKKYNGRPVQGLTGKQATFDHVIFSSKDGVKTKIPLRAKQ